MSFVEDNPFDIGEKTPAVDEEDGQNDDEGEEEAAEEMRKTDHPEEESAQEPKDGEEENVGDDKDDDPVENNVEEADKDEEAANGDLRVPLDEEQNPKVRNSQMSTDTHLHIRCGYCLM